MLFFVFIKSLQNFRTLFFPIFNKNSTEIPNSIGMGQWSCSQNTGKNPWYCLAFHDSVLRPCLILQPCIYYWPRIPVSVKCETRVFADDTVIYLTTHSNNDSPSNRTFMCVWSMEFNADKCETVRITRKRHPLISPTNCTPSRDIVLFSLWGNIPATGRFCTITKISQKLPRTLNYFDYIFGY